MGRGECRDNLGNKLVAPSSQSGLQDAFRCPNQGSAHSRWSRLLPFGSIWGANDITGPGLRTPLKLNLGRARHVLRYIHIVLACVTRPPDANHPPIDCTAYIPSFDLLHCSSNPGYLSSSDRTLQLQGPRHFLNMFRSLVTALALSGASLAHGDHGDHSQKPIVDENANWMTKHMAGG